MTTRVEFQSPETMTSEGYDQRLPACGWEGGCEGAAFCMAEGGRFAGVGLGGLGEAGASRREGSRGWGPGRLRYDLKACPFSLRMSGGRFTPPGAWLWIPWHRLPWLVRFS